VDQSRILLPGHEPPNGGDHAKHVIAPNQGSKSFPYQYGDSHHADNIKKAVWGLIGALSATGLLYAPLTRSIKHDQPPIILHALSL